jgi:hypothetical protein
MEISAAQELRRGGQGPASLRRGFLGINLFKFFARKLRICARVIGRKFEVLVSETVSKQKPKKGKYNYESE